MADGKLHELFRAHLPKVHFQRIESGGLGRGTPDLNGCFNGQEVWIENKMTNGWTVSFRDRPQQVAWLERRSRAGGRCVVAVRQLGKKGRDTLWLVKAEGARFLHDGNRLDDIPSSLILEFWEGGPAAWDWEEVERCLFPWP